MESSIAISPQTVQIIYMSAVDRATIESTSERNPFSNRNTMQVLGGDRWLAPPLMQRASNCQVPSSSSKRARGDQEKEIYLGRFEILFIFGLLSVGISRHSGGKRSSS